MGGIRKREKIVEAKTQNIQKTCRNCAYCNELENRAERTEGDNYRLNPTEPNKENNKAPQQLNI